MSPVRENILLVGVHFRVFVAPVTILLHGAKSWLLCAVRYVGFCPAHLQAAPMEMRSFLASQLQIDPTALQTYGLRRMTRSAHFNAVLNHLGFRRVQPEDHGQF